MNWYEIVDGSGLAQGDLIRGCPVPTVMSPGFPLPAELEVSADERDLVVLSQSCDLENDKIDGVLLAVTWSYSEFASGVSGDIVRSGKWRRAAVQGLHPAHSLLPERTDDPPLPWTIVDFHHLVTLPKDFLVAFAAQVGPRLRLVPPYREHLAQAFARYVMRVGLPAPLTDFEAVTP